MYKDGEIAKLEDLTLPVWERGVRQGGSMDKDVAKQNLLDFKKSMNSHKIKFVLFFGTLLGAIRGNDFIDWDTDIDVICFAEDHQKIGEVVRDLRKGGFYCPSGDDCPALDNYFIKGGEKIDINWFIKVREERIYYEGIQYSSKYFNDLREVDFLGTKFKIPNHFEELLTLLYDDWKIPKIRRGNYL